MATSRIAEHVGRVLGDRYRLTRALGTGASAHVYVAEDVTLRRRVAVKLLHPGLADDDAFLRRFQAEARVVAGLRHPHIVRVYDWGEDDGAPFLVMELLEGGSLRSVLDRGHLLTPAQGALIGGDAARALDYAHRRGLVHRDIKPANLLFDEEGQVSIADFGLARALAEATWTEPAGAVLGTARYAAPEQVRGVALDGKADVYALALVLVEAVTGRVPFATDTTIGTLMARVDRPLPLPDQLGPLAVALAGAGMPDVADRADAAELARALEVAANELPAPQPLPLAGPLLTGEVEEDADLTAMPARPVLFDGEARVAVADGQTAPTAPLPGRRRRRRRFGEWGLILVAVAALLGAAGLVAVRLLTPSHAVPSVVHQTEADARLTLSPLHFHVGVSTAYDDRVPKGSVIRQHPDPGRSLREHSTVTIVVSLGPAPVPVPDLT
ncbi:MAG TPA: protein kinase, partial [Acidimicrobiales bacterium]|nr:protein kinase [Acidimicrobiales bacterium]